MNLPSYGTLSEMQFIDGLGSHAPATADVGRGELLRRYLAALSCRTKWSGLDRPAIESYVRGALGRMAQ